MAKKTTPGKPPVLTQTNSEEDNTTQLNQELVAEKIAPYLLAYPDECVFLITTDGQVFLNAGRNDAMNHQNRIDKENPFITYTRTKDEATERQDQ